MSDPTKPYIVGPVRKALAVLQCVAGEGRELALTEVCYKVGLPKTTTFRYLCTLVDAGLLAHDPKTDLYRTGLGLWVLGQSRGTQSVLREVAYPTMIALRDRFNETVNLAQADGAEVVYLEMVESRRSLRTQAKLGSRDPISCTSVGKAMLAFMDPPSRDAHLPAELPRRAPATLVRRADLIADLDAARERGYAMDREENEEHMTCFGAPIRRSNGDVVAAISVSAPTSRLTRTLEEQIGAAVVAAAAEISAKL